MNRPTDATTRAEAAHKLGQASDASKPFGRSRKLNYIIAAATTLTVIVAVVLLISLSVLAKSSESTASSGNEDEETTTTKPIDPLSWPVKYALDEFSTNMKQSVDACDDFYEYACGSFAENKPEADYFTIHQEQVYRRTVQTLERKQLIDSSFSKPLAYLTKIWHSCVHDASTTADQMKKLTKYLQQLDTLESWQSKFVNLTKDGYNVLITVEPGMDGDGMERGSLGAPELEFAAAYSTEKSSPLLEYYASLIKLYKDDVKDKEAVELAREIIEFEHWMFTNTTTQIEKARGPPMSTMRLNELDKLTLMDWNKTFTTIIGSGKIEQFVWRTVINDVKYVKNFRKMMDSKDEAFLSEYLKLAVVRQSCFFLGQECRDLHFKMASSVHKFESEQKYKERTCYNTLDKHLQELLFKVGDLKLYQTSPFETQVLTEHLADTMDSMVGNLTWMDDETKERVFERVRKRFKIEYKWDWYLDIDLDGEYLDAPYINITDNVDIFDYFTGFIQFHKKQKSLRMEKFRFWPLSLFATHPSWSEPNERLYVPFFFMKGLFNADDLLDQIRFGFYGSLLTHEMTHQFDALAANFTEKYTFSKKSIWSKDSRENFDKQMQCLIDAYDGQQVASGKINGTFTLDENLADLIGVNAAFESWKNNTSSRLFNASEIPDPLKDLMDDRLFFLAYANSHCSRDAEQMPVELQLGLKTPHKLRVNLPLAHSDHFAQAFKCAPGSKMNPVKKCPFK